VEKLYSAWTCMMPRVHPCYAVKCNPDEGLLAVLASLGAGFDCASEAEIAQVLALGVSPDRVVYAHPCKPPKQIRWAAAHGVNLTTFDTESELLKMAQHHAGSGLLLRIRADDPAARCQLGNKYGAELASVPRLLEVARDLGLPLRGVSFHVGSGAKNPAAFRAAVEAARHVFDLAIALGFDMDTLDLGGGFCGGDFDAAGQVDLGGVPAAINAALDDLFPEDGETPRGWAAGWLAGWLLLGCLGPEPGCWHSDSTSSSTLYFQLAIQLASALTAPPLVSSPPSLPAPPLQASCA
jgi:ornithine decarboxylase